VTAPLRVVVDGAEDAPVLVLGSSIGSTPAMWDPQVDALAAQFRLVRYGHPGHGGSPAPDGDYALADLGTALLATLDDLGVGRVHLGGLSLGGMVAMWVASHAPARVDRLVLVCTSALLGPAQMWHDRASAVRAGGMATIADAVLARWFTPAFAGTHPEVVAGARDMLLSVEPQGYAGCCNAIATMDLRADLAGVTAPTLVVAGADDPATPPEHAREIGRRIAGARVEVVPSAAHLANVEAPEAVTALLLEHLTGDLPPTHPRDDRPTDDRGHHAAGTAVRRAVLGDAHVDTSVAATDEVTADFQDLLTRYAWGDVWTRPGLDRRTRSAITVAMLAALHHDEELAMHLRGALRNGLRREEIVEVLLQVGVYAGIPAANRAFRVAQRVLAESP
jgi:3-oxoadipate enol-lactonase / 4-carboxymuconolactone decarboxylase